jgi:hypothetical protein
LYFQKLEILHFVQDDKKTNFARAPPESPFDKEGLYSPCQKFLPFPLSPRKRGERVRVRGDRK